MELEKIIKNIKLEDIPIDNQDIVIEIGMDNYIKIVKLVGGTQVYIPTEKSVTKKMRDREIRSQFKNNYKELSRKYSLSQRHIKTIIATKE